MWDQRYDTAEFVFGKTANEFLASVIGHIPPGNALCLAEGEGRNAVFLAQHGHQVLALDASAVGLEKAKRLATEHSVHIETQVVDLAHVEITPGKWDAIVSIFAHVAADIRPGLHRKIVQGLRPGGVLVLEAYTPAQLKLKTGGPPHEEMMMSLSLLRQELAGLNFRHALELERNVVEGKLHTGRGAVVQVLAFKP